MEFFKKVRIFDFVAYSTYGLIFSTLVILGALALIFFKGFVPGIDFAGGSTAQIRYDKPAPISQIRERLDRAEGFRGSQVSEYGSKFEVQIKIPYTETLLGKNLNTMLVEVLKDTGNFELRKLDTVGPKVGNELKQKGILSLILAAIAMMLYVSFRYEWRFALASILALLHDVIITAASVIVFHIDLNLEVVAALLTLLGYSINDTIIVFDRIRERMLVDKSNDIQEVINEAISHTLSRTLLTSLTVFFVLLTLYLFGGENIIGFSLPMLVGVVFGTYSSMFLAPKLTILLGFDIEEYHRKEARKIKRQEEKRRLREMYENGRV
ncbi:protein translocase subunit SecF [Helicobacter mustelae]|uniref:Protein-export membrane protein SecF n=1 Tax=Helicobacter mustelae (strain ATCC 43772 / CCUG 25715 / CIP 103759 / LMG 18044 / NCTC 12198 / R85-136P) TaxID=679897 RepID=D3UIE0_HELM1|nr:protein translocase subunit SecF [Helicobacter mustelae]CBG40263.1 protein-export membrane protein [Helicobacter mustelae 12198]SQH71762.1 protein-export membrane protein [Helicobacter mustelae]STP12891.1 protein-export membrane protein [Helicobacter mustelae]